MVVFFCVRTVYGYIWVFLLCLVGCFSMIIWTPTVLSVLYACALYFCICTCSAQLSMFHMDRRSRNTLIIIIIIKCRELGFKAWSCHNINDSQLALQWLPGHTPDAVRSLPQLDGPVSVYCD